MTAPVLNSQSVRISTEIDVTANASLTLPSKPMAIFFAVHGKDESFSKKDVVELAVKVLHLPSGEVLGTLNSNVQQESFIRTFEQVAEQVQQFFSSHDLQPSNSFFVSSPPIDRQKVWFAQLMPQEELGSTYEWHDLNSYMSLDQRLNVLMDQCYSLGLAQRSSQMTEIFSLQEAWEEVNEGTFIFLDLDTLMHSEQLLGTEEFFLSLLQDLVSKGWDQEAAESQIMPHFLHIHEKVTMKLNEQRASDWIKELQERGLVVLALTRRSLAWMDVTLTQLRSLGIDFSYSPPLEDLQTNYFRKGILFSAQKNRGMGIGSLLSYVPKEPKQVLFVGSERERVESFQKAISEKKIPFRGFHYRGFGEETKGFNRDLAQVQAEFAGKILSDDAARAIVESRKKSS